jgi:hypothetical protein
VNSREQIILLQLDISSRGNDKDLESSSIELATGSQRGVYQQERLRREKESIHTSL